MTTDTNLSLGEFLRQERERRGITIEQVASATKISVRLLHSIESDHYVDLPAKPFIRGFVTSYARFIGLEPNEILTRFNDFIELKAHDRPSREGGHSGYAFERKEGEQSRTILWVVMGGFVVLGGLLIFVLKPSLRHHRASQADRLRAIHATASPSVTPQIILASPKPSPTPTATGTPTPTPTQKPSPAPTPKATPTGLLGPIQISPSPTPTYKTNGKPDPLNSGADLLPSDIHYKVVFKALADIWVRYRVDQKPTMKFILRADRILVLRGRDVVHFQVSNPKAVTFNFNSKGSKLAASEKNAATHQSGETLVFPPDHAERASDPFPSDKPLPLTPPPAPRTASPSPSPQP